MENNINTQLVLSSDLTPIVDKIVEMVMTPTWTEALITAPKMTEIPDSPHHKLDTDTQVFFYEQDYYVLSNFSSFTLQWKGLRFDTSEAAYHWEKFDQTPWIQDLIRLAPSAHEAYKIAQRSRYYYPKEWWNDRRVYIMGNILRAKVAQHEYVHRKLLETGIRELVEDSHRDSFWGWGPDRKGQNMLGKLWMEVREEIRANE